MYYKFERVLIIIVLLFATVLAKAQNFKIYGFVNNESTGEPVRGAAIFNDKHQIAVISNDRGFFTLTLPFDSCMLEIIAQGYQSYFASYKLGKDQYIQIDLKPNPLQRLTKLPPRILLNNQGAYGNVQLSSKAGQLLPSLVEPDLMRGLQALPGVNKTFDGLASPNVRGGNQEQNLYSYSGIPLYQVNHIYGYSSIINPFVVDQISITKGGFSAKQGGRLSSVIEIAPKDGPNRKLGGWCNISPMAVTASFQGSINAKTNYIFGFRRSYLDVLLSPFIVDTGEAYFNYTYYDFNGRMTHKFSDKDELEVDFLRARDHWDIIGRSDVVNDSGAQRWNFLGLFGNFGSAMASIKWNHIVNPKLYASYQLGYTTAYNSIGYYQKIQIPGTNTVEKKRELRQKNNISDYILQANYTYTKSNNEVLSYGASLNFHLLTPGLNLLTYDEFGKRLVDSAQGYDKKLQNPELAIYVEDFYRLDPTSFIKGGLRGTSFKGYDQTFLYADPHVLYYKLLKHDWNFYASYDMMHQALHLLSTTGQGRPGEIWVPASRSIKPQRSQQLAFCLSKNISKMYSFSGEVYYKTLTNLAELKTGAAQYDVKTNWQDRMVVGAGKCYGLELMLKKQEGLTFGWLTYTLSWSNRSYNVYGNGATPAVNQTSFPYRFDRRHQLTAVLNFKVGKRKVLSFLYTLASGNPISVPALKYRLPNASSITQDWNGQEVFVLGSKNNYRMPSYQRLDMAFKVDSKRSKWKESSFGISVYNLLFNKNSYDIFIQRDPTTGKLAFYESFLFPFFPTFNYSFRF